MNKLSNTILTALIAGLTVGCGASDNQVSDDAKLASKPQVNEVEIQELKRTDFSRQLISNGRLKATRRATLSFGVSGCISELNVKNGSLVNAGEVLAKLDRPDLKLSKEAAEISVKKAELELYDVLAGQGYKAADTVSVPADVLAMAKMRSGYISAVNSLRRAVLDYNGTILKAPFTGRVADLKLKRYDMASATAFCTIVDDSTLDVDFSVMESEYSFLAKGLSVKIIPFVDRTKVLVGKVTEINPVVDKSGQIFVRASLSNNGELIDGMNVKVIVEKTVPDCLVVPRSAVVVRDNLDVLFTYTDDGIAHWTYVNIIQSNGDSHVVEPNLERGAMLTDGDKVIVSGNLNLADGSQVQLKD